MLFGAGEPEGQGPAHPLVSHVPVPGLTVSAVEDLAIPGTTSAVRRSLAALCEATERARPRS